MASAAKSEIDQFGSEWASGSWSVGQTRLAGGASSHFTAFVHGHGTCASGSGKTAREAFDKAVASFRESYPDALTAARKRLDDARSELARAEAFAAEVEVA